MNKLDQVRTWIKRYGLQNVILRGAKMILPIQRIANNKKLRTINWQSYCKKKLKKHLVFIEHQQFLERMLLVSLILLKQCLH